MVTRYEEDFKKSIVEMVKACRRSDELETEYGPSADLIRNLVKKYAPLDVNGESVSANELKKLRKELAILKKENEILKRSAVGWYINWYNNTRISLRDAAYTKGS
ncbi:hypothetical protein [Weissella cibaria]|uniref:Transposase n=1 Tax=Weissella cibaria TaxID=137591 RepID=A0A2S1KRS6_9LACO|nr:hypothetical protein [Weissella cibaria]AWF95709.1 hypothetical protein B6254_1305 [Weissella cibaria]MCR8703938.1 hypothetical protein [Weissella cibaria]MDH5011809.1 hypothetical protein [Weissella cibaria]TVV31856.1 hypothetical protein FO434_06245 [Weissella cibaria]